MTYVIDSSAILALVLQETGEDEVAKLIRDCVISPINLVESLSKAALKGLDPDLVRTRLLEGGLRVADLSTLELAGVVALHPLARVDVSLADRFCLALAIERRLPVVTADRPWASLGLPVELRFIR